MAWYCALETSTHFSSLVLVPAFPVASFRVVRTVFSFWLYSRAVPLPRYNNENRWYVEKYQTILHLFE